MSTKDSQANFDSLRECPFCGGEAAIVATLNTTVREWFVTCGNLECNVLACRTKRYLTKAEAIAAWNARADYHGFEQAAIEAWESIKAWNARAERGTLTAEQVREAIACNSWQETSMLYEFNDSSWQAIADELNARAERTCRIETRNGDQYCTRCGEMVGTCDIASELYVSGNMVELWNYCPNCGSRVVG